MVKGRLNKELKEICLMDQVYVKAEDGKQSVSKYVEEVAKATMLKLLSKVSFVWKLEKESRRKKRTSQLRWQLRWLANNSSNY